VERKKVLVRGRTSQGTGSATGFRDKQEKGIRNLDGYWKTRRASVTYLVPSECKKWLQKIFYREIKGCRSWLDI
jgi:hypothetical protein